MNVTPLHEEPLSPTEAEGLATTLDALGVAWWMKDARGAYLRLNAAGHALLGVRLGEALGRHDEQLMPIGSARALAAIEADARQRGELVQTEHAIDVGGVRREIACAVVALPTSAGAQAVCLGVWLDRSAQRVRETELRAVLAQLEVQQQMQRDLRVQVDGRTARAAGRVVAREVFDEQVSREIDLSIREHREFAVVRMAVDGAAGGRAGEAEARGRIVEVFDGMLRSNTRAMDVPSRQDEEGFALLLSGVGLATAHARMEGLRRQCATQVIAYRGEALHFSVSMGIASYPHTAATREGLLDAARVAFEQACQRGGDQVVLASISFGALASASDEGLKP